MTLVSEKWEEHQVSLSIHDPCPLPSRKSHFIARWTIAPLNLLLSLPTLSGSSLHVNCPIHFGVMTFYSHFRNGCSCIIIFMRHFPVPLILQHPQREGILNTVSHAIYVCGMWCTKSNSTVRKIYIMWKAHLPTPSARLNWNPFHSRCRNVSKFVRIERGTRCDTFESGLRWPGKQNTKHVPQVFKKAPQRVFLACKYHASS